MEGAATSGVGKVGGARSAVVKSFLKAPLARLLINGKWVPAKSGKTFDAINPTNEDVLAHVAEGDKADVDEAVKAARKAFESGPWSRTGPHERARIMRRFADLIERNLDDLAELESLNNGMTLATSKAFIAVAAESVHHFAGMAANIYGETVPS